MSIDVYFKSEIENVIRGINHTNGNTEAVMYQIIEQCQRSGDNLDVRELDEKLDLYHRGYRDALISVALVFGILLVAYE